MSRLLLLLALGCGPKVPPVETLTPPSPAAEVTRSPIDQRDYRYVRLDNGMQALLIHDPDTDMAAASLAVHVGHYADPVDRQGLAHFLEHMLFMGTERYPDVDEFQNFVQSNGGATNAGTGGETTGYFFRVEAGALVGAFDRFAQFFVAPLLDPAYVDRERHAVHNEYFLKIQQEDRRTRQVRKVTTNPAHPEAKFSVGNLDTLGDREGDLVYEDLRALYAAEYRPDRMAVAVIGRESLDALETMVRAGLSDVRGEPVARAERPPPYLPEQLGVRIDLVPLAERREIEIQFPLPSSRPMWPNRPHDLVAGVLGHEGEGTLVARLKEAGWAEWVRAGVGGADDFDLLTVTVGLTEEGAGHVDETVASVFQAIRLLAADPNLADRHAERARKGSLDFAWAEEVPPAEAVEAAVDRLLYYPPEHALDAWYQWGAFDAEQLSRALAALTPESVRVLVVLPGASTDQVEPLYEVPYAIRPLTAAEKSRFRADGPLDIALPALNPWWPTRTDVLGEGDHARPQRLSEPGAGQALWHLQDTRFGVPRAQVRLSLRHPAFRRDDAAWVTGRLVGAVLRDHFAPDLYPMGEAGIGVSMYDDDDGLHLVFSGYDDRLSEVVRFVLEELKAFRADPERVAVAREGLARGWRNQVLDRPSAQTGAGLSDLLWAHEREERSLVGVLEGLGAPDVDAALAELTAEPDALLFVHGNVDEARAREVAAVVEELFSPTPRELTVGVRGVPPGSEVVRDLALDHNDSAVSVAYVANASDDATRARYELLGALLRSPFFSRLRTEEQLGYVVGASARRYDVWPALVLVIQSSTAAPDHLLARIDAFLADFAGTLESMPADEFETVKEGLRARLLEEETQLFDRSDELWSDLVLGRTTFDGPEAVAAAVATLEQAEMAQFYRQVLLDEPGRLVVRSVGKAHADATTKPGCPDEACAEAALGPVRERPL